MSKVEIFSSEYDGYQYIYIDGKYLEDIHANDGPLDSSSVRVLVALGHEVVYTEQFDMEETHLDQINTQFLDRNLYEDEEE